MQKIKRTSGIGKSLVEKREQMVKAEREKLLKKDHKVGTLVAGWGAY